MQRQGKSLKLLGNKALFMKKNPTKMKWICPKTTLLWQLGRCKILNMKEVFHLQKHEGRFGEITYRSKMNACS
jgi:hypothetical protein